MSVPVGATVPINNPIQPNASTPQVVDQVNGTQHLPVNQTAGTAVLAEMKATTGTVYTVPSGVTLTGTITITCTGPAGGKVTVAAGGTTYAEHDAPGTGNAATTDTIAVSVPASTALVVSVSGSAVAVSVVVAGYYK